MEWTSSTPKGCSLPSISTARLLATPSTRSAGGIEKRRLARPVVDDHVQAGVERGAGVGVAGRRDPAAGADHLALEAGAQVEAAAVAAELPDAGAVDALDLGRSAGPPRHQRLGVAVLQRPLAEPGDRACWAARPLQLLLGAACAR